MEKTGVCLLCHCSCWGCRCWFTVDMALFVLVLDHAWRCAPTPAGGVWC